MAFWALLGGFGPRFYLLSPGQFLNPIRYQRDVAAMEFEELQPRSSNYDKVENVPESKHRERMSNPWAPSMGPYGTLLYLPYALYVPLKVPKNPPKGLRAHT